MSLEGKRKNRWQYILFNLLHFTLFRVHLVLAFLTISVLMCPPMSWFITMVIKWLGLVNGLWFSINEHKVYCHVKCVKLLVIKIILYWCFILWLFKPEKKHYCNIEDETKYKIYRNLKFSIRCMYYIIMAKWVILPNFVCIENTLLLKDVYITNILKAGIKWWAKRRRQKQSLKFGHQ